MIVKKRTKFEYSLKGSAQTVHDYLNYIEYERNLDLLRKERKERLNVRQKKAISDYAIPRRINFIFERALKRFFAQPLLWLEYLKHLQLQDSPHLLSKVFVR